MTNSLGNPAPADASVKPDSLNVVHTNLQTTKTIKYDKGFEFDTFYNDPPFEVNLNGESKKFYLVQINC